ncbi:heme-binding Shp domain-containing protein [Peptococcus simiae]|uniref:heme-binding Shp domain-containing protein n=1 Tax=Peptococcus simiae TaxID=1643805 RepID=UPI00398093E7
MKITIKGYLCGIFLLMLLPALAWAAESADVGIQASYAHPLTGVIEDSGNNEAIGQGMVTSVLSPGGFYEVDNDGNRWLTLRLNMADHLGDVSFSVQNRGAGGFTGVEALEVGRTGTTVDYMIAVPGPDAVLRIEAFIQDMGRSVIFYGLMDGNLTNRQTDGAGQAAGTSSGTGSAGKSQAATGQAKAKKTAAGTPAKAGSTAGKTGKIATKSPEEGEALADDVGLLTADSPELQEGGTATGPWGLLTRTLFMALVVTLVLVTAGGLLGALALVVGVRFLRRYNDGKEAMLYEAEDRLG